MTLSPEILILALVHEQHNHNIRNAEFQPLKVDPLDKYQEVHSTCDRTLFLEYFSVRNWTNKDFFKQPVYRFYLTQC